MDRVGVVTDVTVLDTSWLLELYQVPGESKPERHRRVLEQAERAAQGRMMVTVPVLFEVANHLVHVRNGNQRRKLIERYREDVVDSLEQETPWTVVRALQHNGILLRTQDLVGLAGRFANASSVGYSLADISIIDLTQSLHKRGMAVAILAFDKQLEAHASAS